MFKNYSNTLYDSLNIAQSVSSIPNYNPITGQSYTQDINISSRVPTQADLTTYLQNPELYSVHLREISQYLNNSIMQYRRTLDHFGKILLFNYDLRSVTRLKSKTEAEIKKWETQYDRCIDWLRKFNPKYIFMSKIIPKVIEEGGVFTYYRESKHFSDLVEIPSDYCYITGRWDWGFTYAIDLTWFDRMIGMRKVIPELTDYYNEFVTMREAGLKGNKLAPYQFYPVPIEKGYVFTFNHIKAEIVPPFCGIFKDAMAILDYKNLVKQKTTLDTWKLVAQIIPRDKDGKPIMNAKTAMQIVQITQGIMPSGVKTFSTPMDVQEVNFQNAQNQNNISGLGEQLYWRSVGVNGTIMDLGDKSAASLRLSLLNDGGFVEHLYQQCENFVNLQLYILSRTNQFRVKFYGNRYTNSDDMLDYANVVRTANMPMGKLFGYCGFDAYEIDSVLDQEDILKYRERMKPILSAFNAPAGDDKGDSGGRPEKSLSELSDAGEDQQQYDSNNNK